MNVTVVHPYANVNDDNEIIPSRTQRMIADRYHNEGYEKVRYIIHKYVWQNIDNENVVKQERLNKEVFAHYLDDLHGDLCKYEYSVALFHSC